MSAEKGEVRAGLYFRQAIYGSGIALVLVSSVALASVDLPDISSLDDRKSVLIEYLKR